MKTENFNKVWKRIVPYDAEPDYRISIDSSDWKDRIHAEFGEMARGKEIWFDCGTLKDRPQLIRDLVEVKEHLDISYEFIVMDKNGNYYSKCQLDLAPATIKN